jgi:uncharacterized protein YjbJ (UPF0337 family)
MENNIDSGSMNRDILAGKWKQLRGELKTWWGKLSDDDLDRIGGQKDRLIGLLQERYGYAREHAEQEVERRLQEYDGRTAGAIAGMAAKAQEFGASAVRTANEAAPVVGDKIRSLASGIREKATDAVQVADRLESAGDYLREKKLEHLGEDFWGLVRRYPLRSLLIAFGLWFWLAGRRKYRVN